MKIETRLGRGPLRGPPRPHARQPDRAAGRQPRLRQLGGADEPVAGRGRGRGGRTCRAPATPTSSASQKYGHRDVRNVLERASARETAARVAAGALAQGVPRARSASSVHSHVLQIASVAAPERADLAPEDFAGVDESTRSAASTPRRARRWSRRSTGCARPTRASAASSRCAPSASSPGSARTSPGRSGSTAGSPARSSRSRRSRASRSARPGRSPAAPARRRTTRSSGPRSAATTARPTAPAASRAG